MILSLNEGDWLVSLRWVLLNFKTWSNILNGHTVKKVKWVG